MPLPTIAAIATPPGRGAVGVVRVSGTRALAALAAVCRAAPPAPRVATLRTLEVDGAVVDQALVLVFPAPRSFTGEDVVELQTHGSPRLLQLLLERLVAVEGVRLAEPGEFTRRALLNGRLELTRAEATLDLIDARSEAEVRSAAARLDGALARVLEELYQPLLQLSAEVEGALDFPEDVDGLEGDERARLHRCVETARQLEASARTGARLMQGRVVVLYGPVNAGKSTLFNRLVGAARALVDAEPGTTRDTLEAVLEVGGQSLTLVDTAGLRATPGRLEAMGIARARQALESADLGVLLIPPGTSEAELASWRAEVPDERRVEVAGKADIGEAARVEVIGPSAGASARAGVGHAGHVEVGKADVGEAARVEVTGPSAAASARAGVGRLDSARAAAEAGAVAARRFTPPVSPTAALAVSGLTGEGVERLLEVLTERLGDFTGDALLAGERHLEGLTRAREALERAQAALDESTLEVVAGELSLALTAIGELMGLEVTTARLDALFARFCIGK